MQTVTTPRRLYKAPGAQPPVLEPRGLPVNAGKYLISRYIEQTVNPRETVKGTRSAAEMISKAAASLIIIAYTVYRRYIVYELPSRLKLALQCSLALRSKRAQIHSTVIFVSH